MGIMNSALQDTQSKSEALLNQTPSVEASTLPQPWKAIDLEGTIRLLPKLGKATYRWNCENSEGKEPPKYQLREATDGPEWSSRKRSLSPSLQTHASCILYCTVGVTQGKAHTH